MTPPPAAPRLRVELADPPLALTLGAGQLARLPDDDRVVAALAGRADRRRTARIALDGRRLDRAGPARRVQAGLALVTDVEVASDLPVRDHLAAVVAPGVAEELLNTSPTLAGRGDDPAGVLSGGERRALAWLVADVARPRAVVLDRAGTGLDPDALAWVHDVVDRWVDGGVAVLIRPGRPEEVRWLTHRADGTARDDTAP